MTEERWMTAEMTPMRKAATPKKSGTVRGSLRYHGGHCQGLANLIAPSFSGCGEGQGEKDAHTNTQLALIHVVFSCKDKTSPVLKPLSQELIAAHC